MTKDVPASARAGDGVPDTAPRRPAKIGIDLGGTKIEGIVFDAAGTVVARHRVPAPRDDYTATLEAIAGLIDHLERGAGIEPGATSIGVGMPGSLTRGGLVQNANSIWLNGRAMGRDLETRLQRPVRLANDANCFALSEATDGAGGGAAVVFGAILGTGVGGGIVVNGRMLEGPRKLSGEWGHNPLPWPVPEEYPGPRCWCGRFGCLEAWVSGPGLAADHKRATGYSSTPEGIARRAGEGSPTDAATLARHAGRLARGLASVIHVLDPDVIVLGGGLSKLATLYAGLPGLIAPHLFTVEPGRVDIRPPRWGDASGVRGAAWLWA